MREKRIAGWKIAYYVSLGMFLAGIACLCLSRDGAGRVAGGVLLVAGGLLRFFFCRCPHCGAPMMRLRRGNLCPSCLETLEENKDGK